MLPSPLSSALMAAAASLALRRASGAAAGVSHGPEMASALAGSLPAASAALGGPLKSLRSRPISSSSSSSSTSSGAAAGNHSPPPAPAPPPLPPSARADFAYCADLVRKSDPENFLWAMELPRGPQRAVVLALRAFNVETATAADAASAHSRKEGVPKMMSSSISADEHQAALASARLLWWKEAVAEAAASASASAASSASGNGCGSSSSPPRPPANHPVARALAAVAASGAVAPRSLSARLSRVAAARADDATARRGGAPPATMRELESYGEATAAQLLYLQLEAAMNDGSGGSKGSSSADADHAASHLGRAAALASLLRGTRAHAAARRCYLPLSELERAGTSARELFRVAEARARAEKEGGGQRPPGGASSLSSSLDLLRDFPDPLREATRAVASAALAHLDAARGLAARLPAGASACLLQSVSVSRYLSLLEKTGFDPLAAEDVALGSAAARARHRAALAVETRWRSWRGTY